MIRDIPSSQWAAFFARFSRVHRAWLATIHGVEHGVPTTSVPCVPLGSVTLEGRVPHAMVRLLFVNGVSLCAPRPSVVRVQQTADGAERALEVETADGAFIRAAFRAAVLPERLDGVTPSEVALARE